MVWGSPPNQSPAPAPSPHACLSIAPRLTGLPVGGVRGVDGRPGADPHPQTPPPSREERPRRKKRTGRGAEGWELRGEDCLFVLKKLLAFPNKSENPAGGSHFPLQARLRLNQANLRHTYVFVSKQIRRTPGLYGVLKVLVENCSRSTLSRETCFHDLNISSNLPSLALTSSGTGPH